MRVVMELIDPTFYHMTLFVPSLSFNKWIPPVTDSERLFPLIRLQSFLLPRFSSSNRTSIVGLMESEY